MSDIVKVENLEKHFGDVTAVNDISFSVNEGEQFTLVGPSGCGKTTTLRNIAGFLTPSSGEITIKGENVNYTSPQERDTGMVFQSYALFPHKTVGENIGFGLKMDGVTKEKRKERVKEMLELVNMSGYYNRSPTDLSGGQQQRVALARSMIHEPSVLLLDEPLANLDRKLRQEMRRELKKILDKFNITTIYVTHNQEEALSLSDKIAVMNNGKIEQISEPYELYNNPKNKFVADFIGDANLLPGSISSINNNTAQISPEVEGIHNFEVPLTCLSEGLETNDSIYISLRPEDLRIVADSTASDSTVVATGEIATKTFIGRATQLEIVKDGFDILVETNKSQAVKQTQSELTFGWEPSECHIVGGS